MIAASPVIEQPIFVVGTPRSGTTLTARILGRHSKIFMPGETPFFDDIYSQQLELGCIESADTQTKITRRLMTLYERYNEPPDQERVNHLFGCAATRAQLTAPYSSYCEVLSRFMEIQMRHEQKARWGNNVPRDIFNVEDIVRCFPGVKIIICVRDVRDFLVSYKNKWKFTSDQHRERLKALYHPIVTSLLWKSSMRQIQMVKETIAADNLMIMRYEDLVMKPEVQVPKVCAFVGESFEPDMLNVDTHNSSVQSGSLGIFSTSIGMWRSNLSNEEAFAAQRLNLTELGSFDYKTEHLTVNPLRLLKLVLSAPLAAGRAIYANRDRRGSWMAYLYRRLKSFVPSTKVRSL